VPPDVADGRDPVPRCDRYPRVVQNLEVELVERALCGFELSGSVGAFALEFVGAAAVVFPASELELAGPDQRARFVAHPATPPPTVIGPSGSSSPASIAVTTRSRA
jgi:hypothetical protein